MGIVPLSKCKALLRDCGKWVLDHSPGDNHGKFKQPTQKPGTSKMFQVKVDEYAKRLALASNIVARDAPKGPKKIGWHGQHWRSGKEREMILPEDVEIAAEALDTLILSVPYIIGKDVDVVGPDRCKSCDQEYDHLISCWAGFACPNCFHVVRSMCAAYKAGDPIPEDEIEKIKGELAREGEV